MRKWIVVLIAALTLFSIGGAALAQDASAAVFCGTLAEGDCAILKQAAVANTQIKSASGTLEVNLSAAGLFGPQPLVLSIIGDGSYAITDPAALSALQNVTTLASGNPNEIAKALAPLLKAFSGDLNLTINIPPELGMMAAGLGDPNSPPPQIPPSVSLQLRVVDGIGYINLDGAAALTAGSNLPPGWLGMDLVKAFETAMQEGGASMDMSGSTAMNPMQDMEAMSRYMKVERLADTTVEGQAAAVFQTTVDVAGLLSSPEMMNMMQEQAGAAGSAAADLQQGMQMMQSMLGGISVTSTQTITLNDNYTRATNVDVKIPLDMAALMGGAGSSSGPAQTLDIAITVNSTMSNINNVAPITAPEGAQMGDPAQMMGS